MPEKGKVKWFSNVKGFGFLEKQGSDKDIFVHYSAIQSDGYRTLDQDEEVTFDIVESDRGPQATNLIRVKKPPKAPKAEEKAAEPEKKPAEAAAAAPAQKPAEEKPVETAKSATPASEDKKPEEAGS